MSFLSKRTCAPLAVAALAVVPLLVPAGANAAMAGGKALTGSTIIPALQSATVINSAPAGSVVRYCYDKPLASTPDSTRLYIGTYDQAETQANGVGLSTADNKCVDATFGGFFDVTSFTYASDRGGAVSSSAVTISPSVADSTALIGSATNNGTAARSTAPDLVGVSFSGTNVSFQFDEGITNGLTAAADNGNFRLYVPSSPSLPGGSPNTGTPALASGAAPVFSTDRKTVTIDFGTALTAAQVATATRAAYNPGGNGLTSVSGATTKVQSFAMPTQSGLTQYPDLTSATLQINPLSGNYENALLQFDQNITAPNPASIAYLLADGTQVPVCSVAPAATCSATLSGTNAIQITNDTEIKAAAELIVGVIVNTTATGGTGNSLGSIKAGGNDGAFATGYTVAPEILTATFDTPGKAIVALTDQAFTASTPGKFQIVDNTGALSTAATSLSFDAITTPRRVAVKANFPSIAGARGLSVGFNGLTTFNGDGNVDQVLAP